MGRRTDDSDDDFRERYRELLEELRVILPGVQVLFAFLLTVPFSSRFPQLDTVGRYGYLVALSGAGLSPSCCWHRPPTTASHRTRSAASGSAPAHGSP